MSTFSYLLARPPDEEGVNMRLDSLRSPPEPILKHTVPKTKSTPTMKMTIKLKIILSRQDRLAWLLGSPEAAAPLLVA